MPAGYSKTPLLKKLDIKPGYTMIVLHAPDHYDKLLGELPEDCTRLDTLAPESADFIHLFCQDREKLEELAPAAMVALKKTGMLWVSWPKGSSSLHTDLKREPVRDFLLALGLVDIKVAAVDEDWSGLKFVYRKADR